VTATIYNLDGSIAYQHDFPASVKPSAVASVGPLQFPPALSAVHFVKLDLAVKGIPVSSNFYWRALPDGVAHWTAKSDLPSDLTALNQMPMVTLDVKAKVLAGQTDHERQLQVTLHNPTKSIALMAHVQLRHKSGERVLPVFYSDNYVSLVPDETKTITINAAQEDFKGEKPLIVVDGWNVTVFPASFSGGTVAPNLDAQPDHSPATGLPFANTGLR
jgi:Exo-beta-D-glucosaminidase Ig-fold domain